MGRRQDCISAGGRGHAKRYSSLLQYEQGERVRGLWHRNEFHNRRIVEGCFRSFAGNDVTDNVCEVEGAREMRAGTGKAHDMLRS